MSLLCTAQNLLPIIIKYIFSVLGGIQGQGLSSKNSVICSLCKMMFFFFKNYAISQEHVYNCSFLFFLKQYDV